MSSSRRRPVPRTARPVPGPVPLLGIALVITGCGTLTAEQQARVARVSVTTHEPDPRCQNLGPVDGSRESDGPRGMRGRAVILGGNAVHVDRDGSGTAFYCPDPDPDPEREPAEPVP